MSKPSVLRCKFEDFASLPSEPGNEVYSGNLTDSRGHAWGVYLMPGGISGSRGGDGEDPYVRVGLMKESPFDAFVACSFILRDALGRDYHEDVLWPCLFTFRGLIGRWSDLIKRSEVLDADNKILAKGTLHIDVEIRFRPEENPLYVSPNSLAKKMIRLLENKEDADTSFMVWGHVITAHKAILRMNSQLLFDFCEGNDNGSPIPIDDMMPEIFRIVLRYIYGEEVPDAESIKESGKLIIDAANRFGVVGLKLAVESALIESLEINSKNVVDWLVFADAKTCPLLKEYAMSYCVARSADLFGWESWKLLKESPDLMEELLRETSRILNKDNRFDDGGDLSVNDLRRRLHWEGLDIDGSREMLVSRLEQANKRQRAE